MKTVMALGGLIFVGVAGWQLGGRLSSDAIGMALGVLFGIMAGIPASLMVLAAKRNEMGRHQGEEEFEQPRRNRQLQHPQMQMPYGQFPQQPPVIVVAGQGMPGQQVGGYPQNGYQQQGGYGMHGQMPPGQMTIEGPGAPPQPRDFRVVGEVEEVLEAW